MTYAQTRTLNTLIGRIDAATLKAILWVAGVK